VHLERERAVQAKHGENESRMGGFRVFGSAVGADEDVYHGRRSSELSKAPDCATMLALRTRASRSYGKDLGYSTCTMRVEVMMPMENASWSGIGVHAP
jgi:hypothetical protein